MARKELWPHQEEAFQYAVNRRVAILALEQRLGKTPIAVRLLEHWLGLEGKALVVAPAALLISWQRETQEWSNLSSYIIKGKVSAPKVAQAQVVFVSYGSIHKVDSDLFDCVVFDEFHRVKNPDAKRTKLANHFMQKALRVLCLSGTPIPNRPIEIWSTLFNLGITKLTRWGFGVRYCNGFKGAFGWDFSGASHKEELKKLLEPHTFVLKRSQVKGFRQKRFKVLPVSGSTTKEKGFNLNELEGAVSPLGFDGLAEILREQGEYKAPIAADYVSGLCDEGEKVIVFCYHRSVVEILEAQLADFGVVKAIGGMSPKQVQESVDAFEKGSARVFIGNIISASEGLTLPSADRIVMVEASWVPGVIAQATDRAVFRGGDELPVDFITVDKSIDEYMLYKALKKLEVIESITPDAHKLNHDQGDNMDKDLTIAILEVLKTNQALIERLLNEHQGFAKLEKVAEALPLAEEPKEEPKKVTKAKKVEEPKEEPPLVQEEPPLVQEEPKEEPPLVQEEPTTPKEYSMQEVQSLARQLYKSKGDVLKKILDQFNAPSLSKIEANDYAAIGALLEQALKNNE